MAEPLMHSKRQEPSSAAEPPEDRSSKKTPAPPGAFSKLLDKVLWLAILGVLFFAVMPKDSGPEVGKAATTLKMNVVGGSRHGQSQELPGNLARPLLIEAFASWCGACRRENGLLGDLKDAQDKGRLDVIAVSVDSTAAKALAAKKSWPIPVEVLHDPSGSFSKKYHVEVLPTYILIGKDGNIARVTAGTAGASDIRAWLNANED